MPVGWIRSKTMFSKYFKFQSKKPPEQSIPSQ